MGPGHWQPIPADCYLPNSFLHTTYALASCARVLGAPCPATDLMQDPSGAGSLPTTTAFQCPERNGPESRLLGHNNEISSHLVEGRLNVGILQMVYVGHVVCEGITPHHTRSTN